MNNLTKAIFIGLVTAPAVGRWVELPCADINGEISSIVEEYGDSYDCNEVMCADAENIPYPGEYPNFEELNATYEELDSLTEDEEIIFEALVEDGYDREKALEIVQNGDYMLYDGCDDMTDVAERYCEECGLLAEIPDHLRYYFDFEAYGRDMSYEGHFIFTEIGIVEVF